MTASTEYDKNHGARRGRLNVIRSGKGTGAWSARRNDAKQWLQVRLCTHSTCTSKEHLFVYESLGIFSNYSDNFLKAHFKLMENLWNVHVCLTAVYILNFNVYTETRISTEFIQQNTFMFVKTTLDDHNRLIMFIWCYKCKHKNHEILLFIFIQRFCYKLFKYQQS